MGVGARHAGGATRSEDSAMTSFHNLIMAITKLFRFLLDSCGQALPHPMMLFQFLLTNHQKLLLNFRIS